MTTAHLVWHLVVLSTFSFGLFLTGLLIGLHLGWICNAKKQARLKHISLDDELRLEAEAD